MRTKRGFRIGLACGLAIVWACGSSIVGSDPGTGVRVLVLRGPIQPIAREGEVNDEPVPGAVIRVQEMDGGGETSAVTDVDGTARVLLLPGAYRIDVTECPGALSLPGPETVDVTEGSMSAIELDCDTGIR